jgi:hypothetical protein
MLTVTAVAAAVTAGSTFADSSAPEPTTQPSPPAPFPPSVADAQAAQAQAAFAERFALLRGGEAQGLPDQSVLQDPGVDRAAAREIVPAGGATAPAARLWVAPRYDGTQCLLAQPADAQGPAEACADVEQATGGYLLLTQSASEDDVELYGLVPDGVERVTVAFADGSSATLPVQGNAYAAQVGRPTQSVSFTDATGELHTLLARSAT